MKLYDISSWCKHGLELSDYPYIGEVEISSGDFELRTPIDIDGTCYVIGVLNKKKSEAGVRRVDINLNPEAQEYENNIICPYCGYKDYDSWECQDSDDEYECGRCGGIISYERIVTVEYNSHPKKPPKIIRGSWSKGESE